MNEATTRIRLTIADDVARLTLDDGRANAMGGAFLAELASRLDEVEASPARSVVVFGRDGFFSGGLDLKELPYLPPEELTAVSGRFMNAMKRVFLFPKPVVAAADGHAIAGGMMLYLAADLRLAVDRPEALFGLNEAVTGIPILGGTAALCTESIPRQHHAELILHGRLVDPQGTFDRGITHEIAADAATLEERAVARARSLHDVDPSAYVLNKRMLREPAWDAAVEKAATFSGEVPKGNVFESIRR